MYVGQTNDVLEVKSLVNLPDRQEGSPHIAMMLHSALTIVRAQEQHHVRVKQVVAIRIVGSPQVNAHPPVDRGGLNAL
jgi:hypothetical protein